MINKLVFSVFLGFTISGIYAGAANYNVLAYQGSCNFATKKASINGGGYISPNEFKTNFYGEQLEKTAGGVLVSVGTYRSLILFGLGNFSYGVFTDYDGGIVAYDKALLDLISAISFEEPQINFQRFQFLSSLAGVWLKKDSLEKINNAGSDEASKIKYLLDLLSNSSLKELPKTAPTKIKQALLNMLSLGKLGLVEENVAKEKIPAIVKDIANFYEEEKLSQEGSSTSVTPRFPLFWEDDKQWTKIVHAIEENKIAVIARDVSEKDFYNELRTCLESLKTYIDIIDYSNILEGDQYVPKNNKKIMVDAIVSLPVSSNAKLFFTSKKPIDNKNIHILKNAQQKKLINWYYYFINIRDINLIETF